MVLLQDAEELDAAHRRLRTGRQGRQWGLGALNRGVVVLAVSAWEAYVEELLKESVEALKPPVPPLGIWPALSASVRSNIGRFNNPDTDKVRALFSEGLGLLDVTAAWSWQAVDPRRARERLSEALRFRHQIAHGVSPRPIVQNAYARRLPGFFRRLGQQTDRAVRVHLVNNLGIAHPWPE
jgi:hypothetical protein